MEMKKIDCQFMGCDIYIETDQPEIAANFHAALKERFYQERYVSKSRLIVVGQE